ncbi:hypothetical protein AUK11_02570 [bacterium CG2_30_37_16]|nr:MAG: hypothetical protein AUK11_02570 [bacterium CG2_30_37_16]PIY00490.1 MAG: hypothetical protein COZ22_00060 [bacterium (Candidatus Howlettbacteria) CG_4_10_14_3_um_filter_37_10]
MEICFQGKYIELVTDRGFSPDKRDITAFPSIEILKLLIKTIENEFENITENKEKELVQRLILKDMGKMATNLCGAYLSDKMTFSFPLPASSHRQFGMEIILQTNIKPKNIVLVITGKENALIENYPEAKIVLSCLKDPNINILAISRQGYRTKTPILMTSREYEIIKKCPSVSCYRIVKKENRLRETTLGQNRYKIVPDD